VGALYERPYTKWPPIFTERLDKLFAAPAVCTGAPKLFTFAVGKLFRLAGGQNGGVHGRPGRADVGRETVLTAEAVASPAAAAWFASCVCVVVYLRTLLTVMLSAARRCEWLSQFVWFLSSVLSHHPTSDEIALLQSNLISAAVSR